MMDKRCLVAAEFSRCVAVERLEGGDLVEAIAADEAERKALAARFDLLALDGLTAEVTLRRVGDGPVVRVSGRFSADVVQSCVVSLEPVPARVSEEFAQFYAPEGVIGRDGHVLVREEAANEDDWPEPFSDGRIDIGEAVAQQLALALDPYPRRPGVQLSDVAVREAAPEAGEGPSSPFAALARLARQDS